MKNNNKLLIPVFLYFAETASFCVQTAVYQTIRFLKRHFVKPAQLRLGFKIKMAAQHD